jgi:hypothetical protein
VGGKNGRKLSQTAMAIYFIYPTILNGQIITRNYTKYYNHTFSFLVDPSSLWYTQIKQNNSVWKKGCMSHVSCSLALNATDGGNKVSSYSLPCKCCLSLYFNHVRSFERDRYSDFTILSILIYFAHSADC